MEEQVKIDVHWKSYREMSPAWFLDQPGLLRPPGVCIVRMHFQKKGKVIASFPINLCSDFLIGFGGILTTMSS